VARTALAQRLDDELQATTLEAQYLGVKAMDAVVSKVLKIGEVSKMARAELRYQQLLIASWKLRSKQMLSAAVALSKAGKSPSVVEKSVSNLAKRWAKDLEKPTRAAISEIYKLARKAGHKKAAGHSNASLQYSGKDSKALTRVEKADGPTVGLEPSFDLIDDALIEALQEHQLIWIGGYYNNNVQAAVIEAIKDIAQQGLGRVEASEALSTALESILSRAETPAGYRASTSSYFEGLAANVATNARASGQIRSFETLGVTTYVLVNPMDEKTSEICQHMDGKTFQVADASAQIAALRAATTPEEIKQTAPWLSYQQILEISPNPGDVGTEDSDALASAGVLLPPFHFHCRTTVDIAPGSSSFSDLA
jgi:hypothetical protein